MIAMSRQVGDVVLAGYGLGRVFGEGTLATRVLHPTSIEVKRGEVLVIMGPSGSGKTTLLSLLGLLLTPTEGEVHLGGRVVTGSSADELAVLRRDHVGFVFQQFNLIAGLSALDNVTLPMMLAGVAAKEREQRGRTTLRLVGLEEKAELKPRHLSGGQQQRVAIARALVTGAPVMLCDEPTALLGRGSGTVVLSTLQRLAHTEGRGVVVVTHDERVLAVADRLVEIIDGRAQESHRLLNLERAG
jgi:ABC-type lipoprotein export system ATPase subunit